MAGGEYFATGSEKQFAAYEEYPKKGEGPAVRLWRVPSGFLAAGSKERVKNAGRAYFFAFAPTG